MFINGKLFVCGVICLEETFPGDGIEDDSAENWQVVYSDVFEVSNQWLRDEDSLQQQVTNLCITIILFLLIAFLVPCDCVQTAV